MKLCKAISIQWDDYENFSAKERWWSPGYQTTLPLQKNVILRYRSTWWNEQMEENEQFPEIYYHTDFFPNLILQLPFFTLITDLSKKD